MTRGKTRKEKKRKSAYRQVGEPATRRGNAAPHGPLANDLVSVFVDDQNLFWGIVNAEFGPAYRLDFGQLLIAASKDSKGRTRGVKTAYIAGIIPDDDSFWEIAKSKGFTVKRGFLSAAHRSKQDDAFLITELTATLYEEEGPSTIVLVAGDADYVPPLMKAIEKGWRTEVAFTARGISTSLAPHVHEFRVISPRDIQYTPGL